MEKSLKQTNQPQIITFVIANVIVLGIVAVGLERCLVVIEGVTKGNLAAIGKFIAVPAILSLVTGILGWAMPRRGKEALVYWKLGKYCLPSCRAFTEFGPADPRVDMTVLIGKVGQLPTAPAEQTAAWYRIYRRYGQESSVQDAHGAYLKFRDMTSLTLALLVGCVLVDSVLHVPHRPLLWSVLILACEYMLLMFAARNASVHLVVNVLAVESAAPVETKVGASFVGKFDVEGAEK